MNWFDETFKPQANKLRSDLDTALNRAQSRLDQMTFIEKPAADIDAAAAGGDIKSLWNLRSSIGGVSRFLSGGNVGSGAVGALASEGSRIWRNSDGSLGYGYVFADQAPVTPAQRPGQPPLAPTETVRRGAGTAPQPSPAPVSTVDTNTQLQNMRQAAGLTSSQQRLDERRQGLMARAGMFATPMATDVPIYNQSFSEPADNPVFAVQRQTYLNNVTAAMNANPDVQKMGYEEFGKWMLTVPGATRQIGNFAKKMYIAFMPELARREYLATFPEGGGYNPVTPIVLGAGESIGSKQFPDVDMKGYEFQQGMFYQNASQAANRARADGTMPKDLAGYDQWFGGIPGQSYQIGPMVKETYLALMPEEVRQQFAEREKKRVIDEVSPSYYGMTREEYKLATGPKPGMDASPLVRTAYEGARSVYELKQRTMGTVTITADGKITTVGGLGKDNPLFSGVEIPGQVSINLVAQSGNGDVAAAMKEAYNEPGENGERWKAVSEAIKADAKAIQRYMPAGTDAETILYGQAHFLARGGDRDGQKVANRIYSESKLPTILENVQNLAPEIEPGVRVYAEEDTPQRQKARAQLATLISDEMTVSAAKGKEIGFETAAKNVLNRPGIEDKLGLTKDLLIPALATAYDRVILNQVTDDFNTLSKALSDAQQDASLKITGVAKGIAAGMQAAVGGKVVLDNYVEKAKVAAGLLDVTKVPSNMDFGVAVGTAIFQQLAKDLGMDSQQSALKDPVGWQTLSSVKQLLTDPSLDNELLASYPELYDAKQRATDSYIASFNEDQRKGAEVYGLKQGIGGVYYKKVGERDFMGFASLPLMRMYDTFERTDKAKAAELVDMVGVGSNGIIGAPMNPFELRVVETAFSSGSTDAILAASGMSGQARQNTEASIAEAATAKMSQQTGKSTDKIITAPVSSIKDPTLRAAIQDSPRLARLWGSGDERKMATAASIAAIDIFGLDTAHTHTEGNFVALILKKLLTDNGVTPEGENVATLARQIIQNDHVPKIDASINQAIEIAESMQSRAKWAADNMGDSYLLSTGEMKRSEKVRQDIIEAIGVLAESRKVSLLDAGMGQQFYPAGAGWQFYPQFNGASDL